MTRAYVGNIDRLGGVATERSVERGSTRRPPLYSQPEPSILELKDFEVRLGPGPVFAYEWLTTTRRWQLYAVRATFCWNGSPGDDRCLEEWYSAQTPARTFRSKRWRATASSSCPIVTIELSLVLLVAPAATAGAICLDKARGTLDHVLATDLSNAEIVLGKLGVRLIPVLGLVVCLLPLSALTSLLGGIDPVALFGSFLTAVACPFWAARLPWRFPCGVARHTKS